MSTEATLARHLQAFTQGVDAIMRDYTEGSLLMTPDGPVKGLGAIRAFFEGFFASAPPELIQALTPIRQDVDGEVAYILWKAEPFITLATDTFVIRDDRIVVQSYAILAPAPAAAPAASPLAAPGVPQSA